MIFVQSEFRRAIASDPRHTAPLKALAAMLMDLRRYKEADSLNDCVLELEPDNVRAHSRKIYLSWFQTGTTDESRNILNDARKKTGEDFCCDSWYLDVFDGEYESALTTVIQGKETWDCLWVTKHNWYVQVGDCYRFLNQHNLATVYYDSARILIEEEVGRATPVQSWNRACLAYVYAALGRKEDALREGRLSVEEFPVSVDASDRPMKHEWLAQTYTLLGEYDMAVEQLEYLMSIPAGLLSLPFLKSAYFTPLRDHPRFKALIKKYEKEYET